MGCKKITKDQGREMRREKHGTLTVLKTGGPYQETAK
jgi:hypothetical protein